MKHIYKAIPGWFSFPGVYEDAVNRASAGAVFVEIGAWKGRSAAFMAVCIANSGKPITFYAVDHWLGSDEKAHKADKDIQAGTLYQTFLKNIAPVAKYITPLRMSSLEASMKFQNGSVDFVCLDGGHSYEDVRQDIDAWLPKIKPDGVIAGDDWNWAGVHKAAIETFGERIEILGQGKGRHWRVRL